MKQHNAQCNGRKNGVQRRCHRRRQIFLLSRVVSFFHNVDDPGRDRVFLLLVAVCILDKFKLRGQGDSFQMIHIGRRTGHGLARVGGTRFAIERPGHVLVVPQRTKHATFTTTVAGGTDGAIFARARGVGRWPLCCGAVTGTRERDHFTFGFADCGVVLGHETGVAIVTISFARRALFVVVFAPGTLFAIFTGRFAGLVVVRTFGARVACPDLAKRSEWTPFTGFVQRFRTDRRTVGFTIVRTRNATVGTRRAARNLVVRAFEACLARGSVPLFVTVAVRAGWAQYFGAVPGTVGAEIAGKF